MNSKSARKTGLASQGSRIRYLPCRAEPGMFKGELLVYIAGFVPAKKGPKIEAQLLVDEHEVAELAGAPKRNQPSKGWLRVTLLAEVEGMAEVILPQPAQPLGERILIEAKELRETAGG